MSLTSEKARRLADQLRAVANELYDHPYLNISLQLQGVHNRLLEEIWQQEERSSARSGRA